MKKTVLLVALSALLLSAMIVPVLAGPSDVVVQVGDWFKYEREVTKYVSTDTFLPEGYIGPLNLADNNTNYVLYTVTDITPSDGVTDVTFLVTYNWKDGTETTETYVESVSTANTMIFMIGADMNAGEMVSDTFDFLDLGFFDYPQRFINRTFDFANPVATRATNELNYTIDIMGDLYNYTMWWDKATGIRVYYENEGDVQELFQAAYQFRVVHKLVDSSIDDLLYIPEAFATAVMMVMLGASTISIVLYRRRKLFV